MVFEVMRTSLAYDDRPCDEAVLDGEDYVVEINTLEDLLKFVDKNGWCIIQNPVDWSRLSPKFQRPDPDRYKIEIYDTWRE